MGGVWGFKLHAVINNVQMMCRFAIVPANEAAAVDALDGCCEKVD